MKFRNRVAGWLLGKDYTSFLELKAQGFPVWHLSDPYPSDWPRLWDPGGAPMQLAVVYGCARVRGQTLGSVPFHVYREDKSGKREKDIDHPLYPILHDTPNAYQTSMEFRESMELSFCLYGNAYAEIMRIGKRITSLNFLAPDRIRAKYDANGRLMYDYSTRDGKLETYTPEKVLHVKNFSIDGICGITPIRKYVIDHALDSQAYGRNFFKNSARPPGVLKSEQERPRAEGAGEKMREDWDKAFGGVENAGKTPVLWKGLDYKPIGVPPEDAQYLGTRQLSTAEIAGGIYGVPLNLLGQPDKSATYASAEQFDIQFVKYTIRPQAVRYEQAFNKALLAVEQNVYCEMDLDGLLRGDSSTQATTFSAYTQNGILSRNEVRRMLNRPEVQGADELTVQSNLIDLDKLASVTNRRDATGGAQ